MMMNRTESRILQGLDEKKRGMLRDVMRSFNGRKCTLDDIVMMFETLVKFKKDELKKRQQKSKELRQQLEQQ